LLRISPEGIETLALLALSLRQTMNPSVMRFFSAPVSSRVASLISHVWMIWALMSPLWLSVPLLKVLAEYLYTTHTGFPSAMLRVQACAATPETGLFLDSSL